MERLQSDSGTDCGLHTPALQSVNRTDTASLASPLTGGAFFLEGENMPGRNHVHVSHWLMPDGGVICGLRHTRSGTLVRSMVTYVRCLDIIKRNFA